ncbi:hypothetical protein GCM10009535_05540 [Streptomyces thermocarboxydovorans]|uniref:Uncharacterized protein n=1 Tax=Streptomyces thermocarboxydovorans TaxID=59298 RepID=A0ABN1H8J8_9ACTN
MTTIIPRYSVPVAPRSPQLARVERFIRLAPSPVSSVLGERKEDDGWEAWAPGPKAGPSVKPVRSAPSPEGPNRTGEMLNLPRFAAPCATAVAVQLHNRCSTVTGPWIQC